MQIHAEYFQKGLLGIQREKGKLVRSVKNNGAAILNIDDALVMKTRVPSRAKLVTYGLKKADIQAKELEIQTVKGDMRQVAHVYEDGKVTGVLELKQLGEGTVYAALAALAVAEVLEINLVQAIKALNSEFISEPGRMSLLVAKNGGTLIDDTYNAAPASIMNGLELVKNMQQKDQKVACVFGSMGELGIYSEEKHLEVGRAVAKVANVFIGIGDAMKPATVIAKQQNTKLDVHWFKDSLEASRMAPKLLKECDIVYLKGSQSQRVERVTKVLLKRSSDAAKLVRQSEAWLNKS